MIRVLQGESGGWYQTIGLRHRVNTLLPSWFPTTLPTSLPLEVGNIWRSVLELIGLCRIDWTNQITDWQSRRVSSGIRWWLFMPSACLSFSCSLSMVSCLCFPFPSFIVKFVRLSSVSLITSLVILHPPHSLCCNYDGMMTCVKGCNLSSTDTKHLMFSILSVKALWFHGSQLQPCHYCICCPLQKQCWTTATSGHTKIYQVYTDVFNGEIYCFLSN